MENKLLPIQLIWLHLVYGGSIYHSGITSATNKAITTVTKHVSQKQQLVVKNGVITSDTTPKNWQQHLPLIKIWQYGKNYIQITTKSINIMKNIFLQTPLKPGVLLRKTFFHTPDGARSVGLAKACVPLKIDSVIEKLDSRI